MSDLKEPTDNPGTGEEKGKGGGHNKRASAAALIDAFAEQYQVDREETGRREKHRIFREWLTIIGLFLAAGVAVFQWRELRNTDHSIAEQAKLGIDQLKVMQGQLDAMEADQRPWVFANNVVISRPIVHDEKGTHISLMFDLKNGGKSPAFQASVRFRAFVGTVKYREQEEVVCKDAQPLEFGITLFPDTQPAPQETGWLIPAQEIEAAKQLGATMAPFIVACISYQLPRTKEYRTTPYEFLMSPALGSTKWPCCKFPIDEKEIAPGDVRLTLLPVTPPT
jgi:hypothetical protein